jgi:hypothetical protein
MGMGMGMAWHGHMRESMGLEHGPGNDIECHFGRTAWHTSIICSSYSTPESIKGWRFGQSYVTNILYCSRNKKQKKPFVADAWNGIGCVDG